MASMTDVKTWGWLFVANLVCVIFCMFVSIKAALVLSDYGDREQQLKAHYIKELQRVTSELNDRWTLKLESSNAQTQSYVQTAVVQGLREYAPNITTIQNNNQNSNRQ